MARPATGHEEDGVVADQVAGPGVACLQPLRGDRHAAQAVSVERLQARYARPGDTVRIDAIFLVTGRWPRHLANVWSG